MKGGVFSPSAKRRLAAAFLGMALAGHAAAATLTVRPGESIQAAIDRAQNGDVIEVQRARYQENLRIDKTITLRGIERPTVDGGGKDDTIRVIAPDVVIEGMIVANSGDNRYKQNAGIYVQPGAHRAKVQASRGI